MPEETSLKRNTDDEVLPQGYSTELSDWKEVIVDEDGKQYVRDTEVLAKLTETDNKLQTLENTVDEDGNQKVTQYGKVVEHEVETLADSISIEAGEESESFSIEAKGESETWVAIYTDQQPWSVALRNRPAGEDFRTTLVEHLMYPPPKNIEETYASRPFGSVLTLGAFDNIVPESLEEALKLTQVDVDNSIRYIDERESGDNATVTIELVRIWRR